MNFLRGRGGGLFSRFGFAGIGVGALSPYLDRTKDRRHLLDFTDKLRYFLGEKFFGDVLVGVLVVDGALEVVAGSGGTQNHGAAVHLFAPLQFVNALGGFAHTNQQDTCG